MFFRELFYNVRQGVAFKAIKYNIKRLGVFQWLLNELSPGSYTTKSGKLTLEVLGPEVFGWAKHIGIAFFVSATLKTFLNASNTRLILLTIGISSLVEVLQFIRSKGLYLNPVNSLLDVGFYVVGTLIFIKLLG